MAQPIIGFVGLTADTIREIEARRSSPRQTHEEIIRSICETAAQDTVTGPTHLDLGQGMRLHVGEQIFLFLNKQQRRQGNPLCVLVVTSKGYEENGKLIDMSKRSPLDAKMKEIQISIGHVSENDNKPVSLSAYRQWHVRRNEELIPLVRLKDPKKARHRTSTPKISLKDLGL